MNDSLANDIRYTIGRNKLKYSVFADLITMNKPKNIHINITKILSSIYIKYLKNIEFSEYVNSYRYVIVSSIINLIGHYRHFFVTHGVTPNIYVYAKRSNEMISSAVDMLSIICAYLPSSYLIVVSGDNLPLTYIKYIANKHHKQNHLVLSKDYIDIQLVSGNIDFILLNKDNSKYYSDDNLYSDFADHGTILSNDLIGPVIFFSGHGLKNSGVKGYGKRKTLKEFEEMLEYHKISNSRYSSAEDFIADMAEYTYQKDMLNFKYNFNSYDLYYRYAKEINPATCEKIDRCIVDKFSKSDLKLLNERYFTGFDSLILEWLVEESK